MESLETLITSTIQRLVSDSQTATEYREPLVGFARADHPQFSELSLLTGAEHKLPADLLPGAQTVVSFFLPFVPWVLEANARHRDQVAREWVQAYIETNALIGQITDFLAEMLKDSGIRAATEPATHNFDYETLRSRWSHKSVAVIAGLGSFGLHHMVITDAGCAGRFGSLVLDTELEAIPATPKERCLYFYDESCLECVVRCPVGALDTSEPIDRRLCHERLKGIAREYADLGLADVCGKCAIGPCAFESAVDA